MGWQAPGDRNRGRQGNAPPHGTHALYHYEAPLSRTLLSGRSPDPLPPLPPPPQSIRRPDPLPPLPPPPQSIARPDEIAANNDKFSPAQRIDAPRSSEPPVGHQPRCSPSPLSHTPPSSQSSQPRPTFELSRDANAQERDLRLALHVPLGRKKDGPGQRALGPRG